MVLRGVRYRASLWCYAVCGTGLAYSATRYPVLSERMVLPGEKDSQQVEGEPPLSAYARAVLS
eukprot:3941912-Rhodomonas_salina.1